MTDTIADMITRIRNGQSRRLVSVEVPYSRTKAEILDVIKSEGYIASYDKNEGSNGIFTLNVHLRYLNNGSPVISEIHRVSRCSCRVYSSAKNMPTFYNSLGTVVLSTSKGIMSDKGAKKLGIGGEVICKIF